MQNKRFSQTEGSGSKEVTLAKLRLVLARTPPLRGWQGSIWQITSLTSFLTDWFKIPFLGELKL